MKTHPLLFLVCFSAFILTFCSAASAQMPGGPPCGRAWSSQLSAAQGVIESASYAVPPGGSAPGLHLKVRNASGDVVIVHLFPQKCVENNPGMFNFQPGEPVTVLGSPFFTHAGGQMNICAAVLVRGSTSLEVRDPDTGSMNYKLCSGKNCSQICQSRCAGKPGMCLQMCMGRCNA